MEDDYEEQPLAVGNAPRLSEASSRIRTETHNLEGVGAFTILSQDMGRAIFVWCSTGSKNLDDVVSAVPMPLPMPTRQGASSLLVSGGDGESREEAESFSQRLAAKIGRMVLLSWNVSPAHQMMTVEMQQLVLQHVAAVATQSS